VWEGVDGYRVMWYFCVLGIGVFGFVLVRVVVLVGVVGGVSWGGVVCGVWDGVVVWVGGGWYVFGVLGLFWRGGWGGLFVLVVVVDLTGWLVIGLDGGGMGVW
jgi:hypothetical protein